MNCRELAGALMAMLAVAVYGEAAYTGNGMITEWGAKVTAENAWREYPRPQMERAHWICLNGYWDYAVTSVTNTPGRPKQWAGKILVPFVPESRLSGVARLIEPDEFLWYTRKLVCHPVKGRRLLLNFEGVDFRAMVFIGHREVTDVPHFGAHEPFSLDITDYVTEGENELTVCVWDPSSQRDKEHPRHVNSSGKQSMEPHGCFYTRSSGIHQTVWMEEVPETYISDYNVTPDFDGAAAMFDFSVKGPRLEGGFWSFGGGKIEVEVFDGVEQVACAKFSPDERGVVKLPKDFTAWSPENPHLYTFVARYGEDEVTGHFGMRKFEKRKDAKGVLRFFLNNEPYYILGTLDQGWWPDGLLTPPSDEAMAFDVKTLKRCGFNMLRKHIKVEPRRYYWHCDRLGILLLQDLPSGSSSWSGHLDPRHIRDYGFQRLELKRMIDELGKVTSIVMWVPYNEGWSQPGEFLTHSTLDWVKRYDPSRLVNAPSGCNDWEGGHLLTPPYGWRMDKRVVTQHRPIGECEAADAVDMHHYRGPSMFPVNERRVSFLGEFGGLGHPVQGHLWKEQKDGKGNWGYGGIKDTATREGLEKTYLELMEKVGDLAEKGLGGSVYTQTTDVEVEINGLMTYDRKVLKYNPDVIRAAHERIRARAARAAK